MLDWIAIIMSGYIQCHGYDQAALAALIAQRVGLENDFPVRPLNFSCIYTQEELLVSHVDIILLQNILFRLSKNIFDRDVMKTMIGAAILSLKQPCIVLDLKPKSRFFTVKKFQAFHRYSHYYF